MTATISARLAWTAYGSSISAFTETHVFSITLDGPPDKPVALAGYRRAEVNQRGMARPSACTVYATIGDAMRAAERWALHFPTIQVVI
jgi:hypothetical protein